MKQALKRVSLLLGMVLLFRCAALPSAATENMETQIPAETVATVATMPETVPVETTEVVETTVPTTEPEQTTVPTEAPETVPETEPEEVPVETEAVFAEDEEEVVEETEEELPEYLKVPLYFQTDYPDELYGSGTVATSGCSITSLAMVATYMTGNTYLPDELAYYFGGSAENNMKRLENGSKALQLPFKKATNWHETLNALHEGKVAIALMEGDSKFTTTQHFIVLTGINDEGKIMVNDPLASNYTKWDLDDGFIYGFEEYDILTGYSGAWIYDKSAMPEEPFLYSQPRPDPSNARYPDIQLTDEEKRLLAKVIWVEARGESDEGQQAVAEVILNRLASPDFPDTLEGVIYARGQFRSIEQLEDATPYQAQYMAIERALYGPFILPEDVVHFATYKATDYVWGQIGGHYFCYDWNYSEDYE